MEAVLRKDRIVSNRNRDTALYSLLNSDWEDAEIKIKNHLGLSLKPVMHNAIEIDSGRDIDKQIRVQKEMQLAKQNATSVSQNSVPKNKQKKKK